MTEKTKTYDSLFKETAVLLSYKNNSVLETAIELNITAKLLSKWRSLYKEFEKGSFPGRGHKREKFDNKKIYELERTLRDSRQKLEILKIGSPYRNKGKQDLYKFIQTNKEKYPIIQMCEVLEVSTSNYYLWTKVPFSKRETRRTLLRKEIESVFFEYKQQYGTILLTRELNKRGYVISDTQVSFYMKELGLRKKYKKKFKVTTDSRHNLFTSPNVLNRQFNVDSPCRVWVSDITYIQIEKRFLYLTVIIDLYDRKIAGWNLSSGLSTKTTTLPAWLMAASRYNVRDGLLFHSDRGVQYANKLFTSTLDSYNCVRSMSRKGNSLDNAVAESFFNSFKRELIHMQPRLLTPKEMRSEIYQYIEKWYNAKRRHSFLNYKTMEEFKIQANQ